MFHYFPEALINRLKYVLIFKGASDIREKCFYIEERENNGEVIFLIVIYLRQPKYLTEMNQNSENEKKLLTPWWLTISLEIHFLSVLCLHWRHQKPDNSAAFTETEQQSFEYDQIIMFFLAWYLSKQTTAQALNQPLQQDMKMSRCLSWQICQVSITVMYELSFLSSCSKLSLIENKCTAMVFLRLTTSL